MGADAIVTIIVVVIAIIILASLVSVLRFIWDVGRGILRFFGAVFALIFRRKRVRYWY